MLAGFIIGAFVAAEPLLEADMISTLSKGAMLLAALQFLRAALHADLWTASLMTIFSLLVTPGVFLGMVLFGTPVTMYISESLLAATHLSLLAVQPLACQIGLNGTKWKRALAGDLPWSEAYGGSFGTALGAWIGAVPIALDWDRPWQQWPITVLVGAYSGCALGTIIGSFLHTQRPLRLKAKSTKKVTFAE